MTELKINKNGLVPVYLKISHGGNVAGDVAGFPPAEAQKLVDLGAAEPYEKGVHDEKSPNFVKSPDRRQAEVEARRAVQNSLPEFRPAELIHEDEAKRVAALAAVNTEERYVPSTTTTRQEIEASKAVATREPLTDVDLAVSPATAATARVSTAAAKKTDDAAPTPPKG